MGCSSVLVERLREQLERLEAPVLGLVANGIKLPRRKKYGYYGYGYHGYGPGPAKGEQGATAPPGGQSGSAES